MGIQNVILSFASKASGPHEGSNEQGRASLCSDKVPTVRSSSFPQDDVSLNYAITSTLSDYISLLKPRVMSLVLFTGFAGMMLNPAPIHPFIGIIAMLCIALGSGASGAINMWYDRDIDSVMERTKNRPLVRGVISNDEALAAGVIFAFFSVFIMSVCVNYMAGFLLLFTILFYVFVYTVWLKRRTPQNIVIGGLAGALPPLVGWSAASGTIKIEPLILVLIIFLWTPPHFWSLALYRADDYKRSNIPMMPVIYGDDYTKSQILVYTLLTLASTLLPYVVGMSGLLYLASAFLLAGYFIYLSVRLLSDKQNKLAPKTFGYSANLHSSNPITFKTGRNKKYRVVRLIKG